MAKDYTKKQFQQIEINYHRNLIQDFFKLSTIITGIIAAIIPALILSDLFPNSPSKINNQNFATIEKNFQILYKDVERLKKVSDPSTDPDPDTVLAKIKILEDQQEALSSTILEDADKALTAKLLREKQITIETNILEIKSSISSINQRVDNLITTVIAIPLIGFILSLVGGLIYYLFNKKNKIN